MAYDDPSEYADGVFGSTLLPGERILWQGKPVKGRFLPQLLPVSCFGVFFLGFALFWTTMAIVMTWTAPAGQGDMPAGFKYFFPLFGLPFVLIGAGLTFGPFIGSSREWRRTLYAVTDRRLLIRGGRKAVTITTTELDRVTGITVSGEGIGTITFHVPGETDPVFRAVERPQEVQKIVEQARRRLQRDT